MSNLKEKKAQFRVKNFNFFNEAATPWVDQRGNNKIEYDYKLRLLRLSKVNPTEALLRFKFKLQILPDVGEIKFHGECIVESTTIKYLVYIMKDSTPKQVKEKNQPFKDALISLVRKRCFEHAKDIGEKENIRFPSFEYLQEQLNFKNKKKTLHIVSENKLPIVPKGKLKNISKFHDFKFSKEYVFPGQNAGKKKKDATFDANLRVFHTKIVGPSSREVKFHFHLKISPDIATIYFDGQCILESSNQKRISEIIKNDMPTFRNVLYPILLKESLPYAEKLGKPYRVGFSAAIVLNRFLNKK